MGNASVKSQESSLEFCLSPRLARTSVKSKQRPPGFAEGSTGPEGTGDVGQASVLVPWSR